MSESQPTALLPSAGLFRGLPEESLARLAALATRQHFEDRDVLFRQGDPGDALHILLSGHVAVSVEPEPGEETVVAILGPGECVGELSLLDGRPRSATIEALEPVETLVLPREAFLQIIRAYPETMEALLVTLGQRLRATTGLAADLGLLGMERMRSQRSSLSETTTTQTQATFN